MTPGILIKREWFFRWCNWYSCPSHYFSKRKTFVTAITNIVNFEREREKERERERESPSTVIKDFFSKNFLSLSLENLPHAPRLYTNGNGNQSRRMIYDQDQFERSPRCQVDKHCLPCRRTPRTLPKDLECWLWLRLYLPVNRPFHCGAGFARWQSSNGACSSGLILVK